MSRPPRTALKALVSLFILLGLSFSASKAFGHEGKGTLSIDDATPVGRLQVRYRVTLRFAADGHPKDDGTVRATATRGAEATVPVTLAAAGTSEDGQYEGTVTFPSEGTWSVRFAAVSPPITQVREETVVDVAPSTSSTSPSTTSSTEPAAPQPPAVAAPPDTSRRSGVPVVVVVLLLAGAGFAAGVLVAVRRRRRAPS